MSEMFTSAHTTVSKQSTQTSVSAAIMLLIAVSCTLVTVVVIYYAVYCL